MESDKTMSDDVTIRVHVDTTEVESSIAATQAQADAAVKEWRMRRMEIIQGVREGLTLISSMMSSFRMAMSLLGQQIDPFFSSLVSMVIATTSMILSAATVISGTGIGATIGAYMFAVAMTFNLITLGKLVADKAHTMGLFDNIDRQISMAGQRTPIGGSF